MVAYMGAVLVGNRLDEALTGSVQPLGAEEKAAAKMRRFMRETGRKALEIAGILMAGRGRAPSQDLTMATP